MDENSAGIESELIDLSTENVATLRSAELSGIAAAITRVRERIGDSESSISGYNPSFTDQPGKPSPDAEDACP
ncbi:hypothetical protein Aab01nite_45160 [Paractinoplanes abujensis]|uniref:FXSXX-COOH protein n=1 Tax=Paractinoplanes abujensis TaxID=882441 RepID=A0A7W7FXP5_9ACTN|nr:hypothetical protein [Actinoplanes abujensis]MBB4690158.1 hypothetical protein [Actinoplanes abujensis]GID20926.1 hypothetical protein Aab01nite_45160 [Actinoplanes abujensis]